MIHYWDYDATALEGLAFERAQRHKRLSSSDLTITVIIWNATHKIRRNGKMTDSKTLHQDAEKDFVIKLDDLLRMLENAGSNLEPLRTQIERHLQKGDLQQMDNIRTWISKCMSNVTTAKQNLDSVSEILNLRKASYEVKEVVVRSWPKRAFTERLSYISTALFPIGSAPLLLAGGQLTESSVLAAAFIWSMATILLIGSLAHIYLDDRDKWAYFEREFELQETLRIKWRPWRLRKKMQ